MKTIYKTDFLIFKTHNNKNYIHYKPVNYNNYIRIELFNIKELTKENAEAIAPILDVFAARLYFVAENNGYLRGRQDGKTQLQKDIKQLLGIKGD